MKFILFSALIVTSFSMSGQTVDEKYINEQIQKGAQYTLVLLSETPKKKESDQSLLMQHLKTLFLLHQQKVIAVFGPFVGEEKYTGMIIFNTADSVEVKDALSKDPFIQRGLMTYESMQFFSIPGQMLGDKGFTKR